MTLTEALTLTVLALTQEQIDVEVRAERLIEVNDDAQDL